MKPQIHFCIQNAQVAVRLSKNDDEADHKKQIHQTNQTNDRSPAFFSRGQFQSYFVMPADPGSNRPKDVVDYSGTSKTKTLSNTNTGNRVINLGIEVPSGCLKTIRS